MQERTREDLRVERAARFTRNLKKIVDSVAGWYTVYEKEHAHRMMARVLHDLCQNRSIYSFRIIHVSRLLARVYVQKNKSVETEYVDYGWI